MESSAVRNPTYHPCQDEYVENDHKKQIVRVSTRRHRSVLRRTLHFLVLHALRHFAPPPSRFLRKYFCVDKQRNVPLLPPSVLKTSNLNRCERHLD